MYVAETTFESVRLDWGQRVGLPGSWLGNLGTGTCVDAAQCTHKTVAHGVATDFVAISALWSGPESAGLRILDFQRSLSNAGPELAFARLTPTVRALSDQQRCI